MICTNCKNQVSRVRVTHGKDSCIYCGGLTETGGVKIDGSITRNSFRVQQQQKQYQSDLTPPYTWDKSSKRAKPNSEFIKLFPDRVSKTFTSDELKDVGVTKLKGKV